MDQLSIVREKILNILKDENNRVTTQLKDAVISYNNLFKVEVLSKINKYKTTIDEKLAQKNVEMENYKKQMNLSSNSEKKEYVDKIAMLQKEKNELFQEKSELKSMLLNWLDTTDALIKES